MIATCQALVKEVIGLGVEEEDRKRTWMADADEVLKRGSVHTARAIFAHATHVFPGKKSVWRWALPFITLDPGRISLMSQTLDPLLISV